MYDKCYFCLDQLPKLKKESTASFFVNFGRNRGTKEPAYITVINPFKNGNMSEGSSSMNMKITPTRAGVVARSYRPTFQHTLNLLEHVTQLLQWHGPTQ